MTIRAGNHRITHQRKPNIEPTLTITAYNIYLWTTEQIQVPRHIHAFYVFWRNNHFTNLSNQPGLEQETHSCDISESPPTGFVEGKEYLCSLTLFRVSSTSSKSFLTFGVIYHSLLVSLFQEDLLL